MPRNISLGQLSIPSTKFSTTLSVCFVHIHNDHFIYFLHKFHGLSKITLRHGCITPYIACLTTITFYRTWLTLAVVSRDILVDLGGAEPLLGAVVDREVVFYWDIVIPGGENMKIYYGNIWIFCCYRLHNISQIDRFCFKCINKRRNRDGVIPGGWKACKIEQGNFWILLLYIQKYIRKTYSYV